MASRLQGRDPRGRLGADCRDDGLQLHRVPATTDAPPGPEYPGLRDVRRARGRASRDACERARLNGHGDESIHAGSTLRRHPRALRGRQPSVDSMVDLTGWRTRARPSRRNSLVLKLRQRDLLGAPAATVKKFAGPLLAPCRSCDRPTASGQGRLRRSHTQTWRRYTAGSRECHCSWARRVLCWPSREPCLRARGQPVRSSLC